MRKTNIENPIKQNWDYAHLRIVNVKSKKKSLTTILVCKDTRWLTFLGSYPKLYVPNSLWINEKAFENLISYQIWKKILNIYVFNEHSIHGVRKNDFEKFFLQILHLHVFWKKVETRNGQCVSCKNFYKKTLLLYVSMCNLSTICPALLTNLINEKYCRRPEIRHNIILMSNTVYYVVYVRVFNFCSYVAYSFWIVNE